MKNLFFAAFALFAIALTTSCQKEDLTPGDAAVAPSYAQTVGPGQTAAGPVAGSPVVWEEWEFCQQSAIVAKDFNDGGTPLIKIYDQNMEIQVEGYGIQPVDLPVEVKVSVSNQFPGMDIAAIWQTSYPVDNNFIIEIAVNAGGAPDDDYFIVYMSDKIGKPVCKGIHY